MIRQKNNIEYKFIAQNVELLTPPTVYRLYPILIEGYGRTCMKSKNTDGIEKTVKFCRKLISAKHASVLEHCNLTFRFITDRAMTHALVRHRHCAFTQESTHYIDYIKKNNQLTFIYPQEIVGNNDKEAIWEDHIIASTDQYLKYHKETNKNQARTLLPNALKTELLMTTNLRSWRHILML